MTELVAVASDGSAGTPESDDLLVVALSTGMTYAAAGLQIGVSSRTVARRMSDTAFRQRVTEAERELIDEARRQRIGAMRRLAELRGKAIDRLEQLVASENEGIAFKASEALTKLDATIGSAVELQALLSERLDRLEQRVGISDGRAVTS